MIDRTGNQKRGWKRPSPDRSKTGVKQRTEARPARKHKASAELAEDRPAGRQEESAEPAAPLTEAGLRERPFPIVGVGASAGGLEAFTQLLQHLPTDTGMGFVLVQHLDPAHGSALTELLAKATPMPVAEVKNRMRVEPNLVYVIPPNVTMTIAQGQLKLLPRPAVAAPHKVIDAFFQSLAEDQKSQAIGVILSGTATDGTLGLEAIKAEGGITFSQDEKSAKYDGMPRSAIASGCVDFVLTPQEIAEELGRLSRHPYVVPNAGQPASPEAAGEETGGLRRILALLRTSHGVDFSAYKTATMRRRVNRRMALNKLERLGDYHRLLRTNRGEAEALFEDLLINVTSFFRDAGVYGVLKRKVFPRLLRGRSPEEPVRLWVVGCSHGQEAYSLAMAYLECAGDHRRQLPAQIFATDVSEAALEKARTGFYPKAVAEEVSPERLRRFFVEVEGGYRVNKLVREMCLFARHNLLADPPFSRLDLISCRNVLIYLEGEAQKKLLPMFHYSLRPGGYLWLGSSETVGAFHDLFAAEDRKHKIFSKKPVPFRHPFALPVPGRGHAAVAVRGVEKGEPLAAARVQADAQREADRLLLTRFAPAGVVIDGRMEVLQFRGDTGPYLRPPPGKPNASLLAMLREGLLMPVRAAIQKARKENQTVRKTGLRVKQNGGMGTVEVEVLPIGNLPAEQRHFLVLFEPVPKNVPATVGASKQAFAAAPTRENKPSRTGATRELKRQARQDESGRNRRLQQELTDSKDYSQSVTEQYDVAMEELQSANEEAQSANEELQSINEELETSQEELQGTNEELTSVNQELQNRNQELTQFHNDLLNLLSSVGIPMVILGPDLRIRRITPVAEKMLNIIPSDTGRSINDIKLKVEVPDLEKMILEVIDTVAPQEREVRDREGRWYLLRLRPYKTQDNRIEGAVLLLLDVAERELLQRAQHQKELYRLADSLNRATTVEMVYNAALDAIVAALGADRAAVLLLDERGAMRFKAWRGLSEAYRRAVEGHSPWTPDIREPQPFCVANIAEKELSEELRRALQAEGIGALAFVPLLYQNRLLGKFMVYYNAPHAFSDDEMQLARTIANQLAFGLERKRNEVALHQAKEQLTSRATRLQEAVAERSDELTATNKQLEAFVYSIAHDLRAPLRSMEGFATMLLEEGGATLSERAQDYAGRISKSAQFMDQLLQDLLAFSQIGQQQLELSSVNLERLVQQTLSHLEKEIAETRARVEAVPPWPAVRAQEQILGQVFNNLITNALKFVAPGAHPKVRLSATETAEWVRVWVEDNGIGVAPEYHEQLFRIFTRLHGEEYPGTGIGLAIVQKGVERMGGRVGVESTPGQGSRFWVELQKA